MIRRGPADMKAALFKRCRTIFVYQAGVILLIAGVVLVAGDTLQSQYVAGFQNNLPVYTALALAMVQVPINMGILPMYLVFMIITPIVLLQFAKGNHLAILMISLVLWAVAQTGLDHYVFTNIDQWVYTQWDYPLRTGIFFDLFGWQVVYFLGLWFGFKMAQGTLDLGFLSGMSGHVTFLACLVAALFFAIYDRIVFNDLISPEYSETALSLISRRTFSAIYVANFLVDLYVVAWLILEAPKHANRLWQAAGKMSNALVNCRPLVFLGQHSLQVFSFHILVQYGLTIALHDQPVGEVWGTAIIIAGVLSLYIPAWIHAQWQARTRAASRAARLQVTGAG